MIYAGEIRRWFDWLVYPETDKYIEEWIHKTVTEKEKREFCGEYPRTTMATGLEIGVYVSGR